MNAPSPLRRRVWLWLLVAVQLVLPASYYVRAEADDERFAWRMFSTVRVRRCQVRVREFPGSGPPRVVDHQRALHSAWTGALLRRRERVVESFLEQRCTEADTARVDYERRCEDVDGSRLRDRATLTCGDEVQWAKGP